jgi:3-phenylpropionate/cinnamic acid dioxygenase small subunit
MSTAALKKASSVSVSRADCEDFLVHEARLLDDAHFDEWLGLFTPEAHYWVPSEPGQKSPLDTVSLMYDDRRLLETRVRRLSSPKIYSQEPRSRTSRIVTNVTIDSTATGVTQVRSCWWNIGARNSGCSPAPICMTSS